MQVAACGCLSILGWLAACARCACASVGTDGHGNTSGGSEKSIHCVTHMSILAQMQKQSKKVQIISLEMISLSYQNLILVFVIFQVFLISTKAPNTIVNPVCCSNLSPFLSEMYTKRLAELGRVGEALRR